MVKDFWFEDPEGDDFIDEVNSISEAIMKILRELLNHPLEEEQYNEPRIYNFSISLNPIDEHDIINLRDLNFERSYFEYDEPLIDIVEDKNSLKVYVELPGVRKEDIKVKATERKITVAIENQDGKYYKEIHLPSKVKPEKAKATFRNGVLEVTFEKKNFRLWKKLKR